MAVIFDRLHRPENGLNSDLLNQEFSFSGFAPSFGCASTAVPVLPDLPETLPDTVPTRPDPLDPDPPAPKRSPFAPPPWVAPDEEPGPKA